MKLPAAGFHWEWIVVRYYGNITGPYSAREIAEKEAESHGTTVMRRLVWKPQVLFNRYRFHHYNEWPGHDNPDWWYDDSLLKWGWP